MDKLVLKDLRVDVNKEYVGFSPDGDSIKPIHIAGGVFRVILGQIFNTKKIKQFAFVISKKGIIPSGSEEDEVDALIENTNCFDEIPDKETLKSMRLMFQKLLNTDNGMYPDNSQLTFSAGSKYFVKNKAQYEDAGEFIGGVIKEYCPELAKYIQGVLNAADDPISILLSPMQDDTVISDLNDSDLIHKGIPAFVKQNSAMKWYLAGLRLSGDCLKKNLERMPNALTRLRIFIFFCIYHLIRYMSLLEAFYCGGQIWPFLFDFSGNNQSGIAKASTTSYARVHQSVSRFYSWAFAQRILSNGITLNEMLNSPTPINDSKKTPKAQEQVELDSQWELAKENARTVSKDKAMLEFGKTIYNMTSMQSSAYPVTFLRILGAQAGIVYPTQRDSKRKHFLFSQDMLEMVIRSCIDGNETITYSELCKRMWNRFNVVISGLPASEDGNLQSVYNEVGLDSDVLEDNHQRCVRVLEAMDFADLMADGILRVHIGGTN